MIEMLKNGIAMFQLVTTVAAFLMLIMMYVGLIETPIR
jgi:hypothetical protein